MRWLKHMTATRKDEKVAALIHKAGHDGYGLWWMVLETVAASMDKGSTKCSLKYPVSKWATELQLLPQHVCRKLVALHVAGLLELRKDGDAIELTIPNLLKYRDEYARKSGHTPDSVRSKIQRQNTDTDTDTDTPSSPPPSSVDPFADSMLREGEKVAPEVKAAIEEAARLKAEKEAELERQFEEIWQASWRVGPKAKAKIAFKRAVSDFGFERLLGATKNFATAYSAKEPQFRPHLVTWLNQERYKQPVEDFLPPSEGSVDDMDYWRRKVEQDNAKFNDMEYWARVAAGKSN